MKKFTIKQKFYGSLFWSLFFVFLPTAAYVISGGPLFPGWLLFPTIFWTVFFAIFFAILLQDD